MNHEHKGLETYMTPQGGTPSLGVRRSSEDFKHYDAEAMEKQYKDAARHHTGVDSDVVGVKQKLAKITAEIRALQESSGGKSQVTTVGGEITTVADRIARLESELKALGGKQS